MERYFKRKAPTTSTPESDARTSTPSNAPTTSTPSNAPTTSTPSPSNAPTTIDVDNLPWVPSERPKILSYNPNQRDEIRRLYWLRGPCQPRGHVFPSKQMGSKLRRFVHTWFDEFRWLEYSVKTDKAYCLCCYLFRDEKLHFGSDAFITERFNNWAKKEKLSLHVGEVNSFHNFAQQRCEALLQQKQSIPVAFHKQTEKEKVEYRMRLNASIDVCRLLLKFGLPFRCHDESETSLNQGLFLGHLEFLGDQNEMARKVILDNAPRVQEALVAGEIESGKGLNQELCLTRAGDTRWGSHQKSIVSLINLFPDVVKLLHWIWEEGDGPSRSQAHGILEYFQTFDFVLYLHLMLDLLVVTNSLSKSLQKKDQNILDAALLIEGTKAELQVYRESGFETLLSKVESFCDLHDIQKKDMAEEYINTIRTRHRTHITNRHHYEYDVFNTVMDLQIREFGDRFSEVSTELIKHMAALSPRASESPYCGGEIDLYIRHVLEDERYANLNGIDELARLMVETTRNLTFPLVYRLLKLALTLPVATASVERCFSTMKLVKTYLRNRMGDEFLNAAIVCVVEKEALRNVKNDDVINRFQKMQTVGNNYRR
ncbi:hypothetical protein OSB04_un000078 [Centaurea solstitialis]|uniref:TTF-type domain-containing protein n=1 Tax=Centaurea solstitialis TaxID=347529 RepID=A0AA38S523_9ASTR|nr:hypothetical protein OSB04_un000078 [Centaurea solstitialis]